MGSPARRIRFQVAYEGTDFAGWQVQKYKRTVQGVLEAALRKLTGRPVRVTGAGRTDAGVHAEGQVAHADLESGLPLKTIERALNAILPEDVTVRQVRLAPPGFHARYRAQRKTYRYRIWNRPQRPLFDRRFLIHVREPLDLAAMRRAARNWIGRHDFKAFHSAGRPVRSTRRTVFSLKIGAARGTITLDVTADGFLYHMARRMAGFLIEVGKGKPAPAIPPTAPARGLTLMKVSYGQRS
ncbi:MAG: tRNA pseudouridine(38-40) synthase TruA [Candidatus Omnitrophica bacterium CG11_big_fil_rev_8_21_14_0_20_64_10]|nr:MAG: tRNA pseudouridine(38-40) synthase TruA [Candidatus Omnitrophica bacterium CG11_big_fil_rev_8_21_14_0_20_64_10]